MDSFKLVLAYKKKNVLVCNFFLTKKIKEILKNGNDCNDRKPNSVDFGSASIDAS